MILGAGGAAGLLLLFLPLVSQLVKVRLKGRCHAMRIASRKYFGGLVEYEQ